MKSFCFFNISKSVKLYLLKRNASFNKRASFASLVPSDKNEGEGCRKRFLNQRQVVKRITVQSKMLTIFIRINKCIIEKMLAIFTLWSSFSSSILAASMRERDCLQSVLKISPISGVFSASTFRQVAILSTSSSVIGWWTQRYIIMHYRSLVNKIYFYHKIKYSF